MTFINKPEPRPKFPHAMIVTRLFEPADLSPSDTRCLCAITEHMDSILSLGNKHLITMYYSTMQNAQMNNDLLSSLTLREKKTSAQTREFGKFSQSYKDLTALNVCFSAIVTTLPFQLAFYLIPPYINTGTRVRPDPAARGTNIQRINVHKPDS